jgi:hypothetical protein
MGSVLARPVMIPRPHYLRTDAIFSDDGRYRYWLERRWDDALPQFTYMLLNPSKAGIEDDPTVTKLVTITVGNGGGGFELVNLFAVVDTRQVGLHPSEAVGEPVNDGWIARVVGRSTKLVLGWGGGNANKQKTPGRRAAVRTRACEAWPLMAGRDLWCFKTTTTGAPHHPGRLPNDTRIVRYRPPSGYPCSDA